MNTSKKIRMAVVFAVHPHPWDLEYLGLLKNHYDLKIITTESIGSLISSSHAQTFELVVLADYPESPTFLPGLEKALSDFDLVIIKERVGLYSYQAMKAKWRHRFRLIVWVDNTVPFPADGLVRVSTIRNEVTESADGFLVFSQAAKETLEIEGVPKEKIYKLKPWVGQLPSRSDSKRFQIREEMGFSEGDLVILYLHDIGWESGLFDLLHGIKKAKSSDPYLEKRLKVLIYGMGSFIKDIKNRAIKLGIDNDLKFYTPFYPDYERVLLACDSMYYAPLVTRDYCGQNPFVLTLAMSLGIPVLAMRSDVVEEYLDKHRLDFCPGSIAGLAKALRKFAHEPQLVDDIRNKNQQKINQHFTIHKIQTQIEAVFSTILNVHSSISSDEVDHRVRDAEERVMAKKFVDAVEVIESIFAVGKIPAHHKSNLYRLMGDCFTKLGDFESGKNAYIKAIDEDDISHKPHIGLGTINLIKTNYQIAVIQFQKSVSLAPNDEMATLGLGLAFQGLNEHKEAHKWIAKSLESNIENTAAIYSLVRLAHEMGWYEDTEKYLTKYISLHPNDHDMIYSLAGIYFKLGKHSEAKKTILPLLAQDPRDEKLLSLMRQLNREQNSFDGFDSASIA